MAACSNNISADKSAQSWVGKSIVHRISVTPKITPTTRILNNGIKEYEFNPYQSYPSCAIIYKVNADGIINSYQIAGICK